MLDYRKIMKTRTLKNGKNYGVEFTQGVQTFLLESVWETNEEAEWVSIERKKLHGEFAK